MSESDGLAIPELIRVTLKDHVTFALCAVSVLAFFIWAAVSPLDIVSMAAGHVVPATQVKAVQHLEGGIVSEIFVREGQQVKKGEPILTLEPTTSGADVGELRVRLIGLHADIARLEAVIRNADKPDIPDEVARQAPDIVAQTLDRFMAQVRRHRNEVERQQNEIVQKQQEIEEINSRTASLRKSLVVLNEKIGISDELLKDNLTNRYNHLDLLKERQSIQGQIEGNAIALQRATTALRGAGVALETIRTVYHDENQQALEEARMSFEEMSQRIRKFEDSLKRTIVQSPVDGTVKTLHVVTVGGVLRPGSDVVHIVPAGDHLIIEAKLPPQDIGYVVLDQPATIKLASSDAGRFGGIEGTVIGISPDTIISPDGVSYYLVRIATKATFFQSGNLRYHLYPGMDVVANIRTGVRTVLEYLTDPLRSSTADAMQER